MTNLIQIPMYQSFNDLVELSVNHTGDSLEVDCNLTLYVDGTDMQAYTCSVGNRDLLFYTDKGTVTYLVDIYGDAARAELVDWELDGED